MAPAGIECSFFDDVGGLVCRDGRTGEEAAARIVEIG
jgi:hypothetical protein